MTSFKTADAWITEILAKIRKYERGIAGSSNERIEEFAELLFQTPVMNSFQDVWEISKKIEELLDFIQVDFSSDRFIPNQRERYQRILNEIHALCLVTLTDLDEGRCAQEDAFTGSLEDDISRFVLRHKIPYRTFCTGSVPLGEHAAKMKRDIILSAINDAIAIRHTYREAEGVNSWGEPHDIFRHLYRLITSLTNQTKRERDPGKNLFGQDMDPMTIFNVIELGLASYQKESVEEDEPETPSELTFYRNGFSRSQFRERIRSFYEEYKEISFQPEILLRRRSILLDHGKELVETYRDILRIIDTVQTILRENKDGSSSLTFLDGTWYRLVSETVLSRSFLMEASNTDLDDWKVFVDLTTFEKDRSTVILILEYLEEILDSLKKTDENPIGFHLIRDAVMRTEQGLFLQIYLTLSSWEVASDKKGKPFVIPEELKHIRERKEESKDTTTMRDFIPNVKSLWRIFGKQMAPSRNVSTVTEMLKWKRWDEESPKNKVVLLFVNEGGNQYEELNHMAKKSFVKQGYPDVWAYPIPKFIPESGLVDLEDTRNAFFSLLKTTRTTFGDYDVFVHPEFRAETLLEKACLCWLIQRGIPLKRIDRPEKELERELPGWMIPNLHDKPLRIHIPERSLDMKELSPHMVRSGCYGEIFGKINEIFHAPSTGKIGTKLLLSECDPSSDIDLAIFPSVLRVEDWRKIRSLKERIDLVGKDVKAYESSINYCKAHSIPIWVSGLPGDWEDEDVPEPRHLYESLFYEEELKWK